MNHLMGDDSDIAKAYSLGTGTTKTTDSETIKPSAKKKMKQSCQNGRANNWDRGEALVRNQSVGWSKSMKDYLQFSAKVRDHERVSQTRQIQFLRISSTTLKSVRREEAQKPRKQMIPKPIKMRGFFHECCEEVGNQESTEIQVSMAMNKK